MKKKLMLFLFVLAIVSLLVGCTGSASPADTPKAEDGEAMVSENKTEEETKH